MMISWLPDFGGEGDAEAAPAPEASDESEPAEAASEESS